jgi:hypothetical protein
MSIVATLRGAASSRQLRLFVCAVCRRNWARLGSSTCRDAVLVAERYADGLAREDELAAATHATAFTREGDRACDRPSDLANWAVQADDLMFTAALIATARDPVEQVWQAGVLRDIFGNPFGLVSLNASAPPAFVKSLAKDVYEERRFEDLPILADAFEEAGCTDSDLLAHCRQPGPHVRGCWVVDLILGKR